MQPELCCSARCSRNSAAAHDAAGTLLQRTMQPEFCCGHQKAALFGIVSEERRFFADVCFLPVRREPDRVAPLCTERRHRHPQRKNARLPLAAAHLMPFEPVVYGRSFSPFSAEPAAISCCCASSSSCFCFLRARRASLRRSLAFSMSLSICSTERSTIV